MMMKMKIVMMHRQRLLWNIIDAEEWSDEDKIEAENLFGWQDGLGLNFNFLFYSIKTFLTPSKHELVWAQYIRNSQSQASCLVLSSMYHTTFL